MKNNEFPNPKTREEFLAKNLLEGKTCDNCKFSRAEICVSINRKNLSQPKENTCEYWVNSYDSLLGKGIPLGSWRDVFGHK